MEKTCPDCGSPMKVRKGKFGNFWGCTNYPDCKKIVNIKSDTEPRPIVKEEPNWNAIRAEKEDNINRAVALKASVDYLKNLENKSYTQVISTAETFLKWLDNKMPFESKEK